MSFTNGCISSANGQIPSHLQAGLRLLKQAHEYAEDLKRDLWDFAVEMRRLREVGLSDNDLRWMIWKGYVEHAGEITKPGDPSRGFRQDEGLNFNKKTCFVLTRAGVQLAGTASVGSNGLVSKNGLSNDPSPDSRVKDLQDPQRPRWDRDRHQLSLGRRLIKEFKLNSPNQEAVLMAFEEEGWPPRIDDPLVPHPDTEPKERLRNTIKSLNRKQVHRLIRFMGDGTGEAIRWELIPPNLEKIDA